MRRLIFILTLVGTISVACSSGKSSNTSSTTGTASTGTSGSTATTALPSFSGSGSSDYCGVARTFAKVQPSINSGDLKGAFAQFDPLVSRLLKTVPSPIKGDWDILVGGYRSFESAVQAAGYDASKVNPAALAALQEPKFTGAVERISAYDKQICKIDITIPTT